jgi:hypothetical protein
VTPHWSALCAESAKNAQCATAPADVKRPASLRRVPPLDSAVPSRWRTCFFPPLLCRLSVAACQPTNRGPAEARSVHRRTAHRDGEGEGKGREGKGREGASARRHTRARQGRVCGAPLPWARMFVYARGGHRRRTETVRARAGLPSAQRPTEGRNTGGILTRTTNRGSAQCWRKALAAVPFCRQYAAHSYGGQALGTVGCPADS